MKEKDQAMANETSSNEVEQYLIPVSNFQNLIISDKFC